MTGKTIREVSEATGISRFTLAHAAKGGLLGLSAEQSGTIWLIDMKHKDFKKWLEAHEHQPATVKGQNKINVDLKTGLKTP